MSKVYLVGAGPGDPELITIKGLNCIKKADVILYDRLVNEELLGYAKEGAELIFCGKLPNFHILQQETINHLLVKHAKKGKIVTRLKVATHLYLEEAERKLNILHRTASNLKLFRGSPLE